MKIEVNIDHGEEREEYTRVPENFTDNQIEDYLNDNQRFNGWYSWAKF